MDFFHQIQSSHQQQNSTALKGQGRPLDGSSENGMDNCKVRQQSFGFLGYKSARRKVLNPQLTKLGEYYKRTRWEGNIEKEKRPQAV